MTVGLDPEWIAANATVDGYRAESAGFVGFIGTGQMSRNARFRLHWAECDGPESVVVKLPSSEAATRAVSFDHDVYLRECVFYRDVASLVDVCVPRALAVHYDAGARDFAILLEDLDGSAQGDQFTEPSDDELQLGIEQCAALHAPLWGQVGDPLLDPFREDIGTRAEQYAASMPGYIAPVFDRLGAGLEADTVAVLERFGPLAGDWIRATARPTTITHGDFRPDNLLF